ncbi:hypothetical protein [Kitasatospora sp. NPDC048407]|uniref:hypothetical protein n=1 Tax=Kitasatospora sp. NPDC048407 TaxID=3364051 RepID=UPI0037152734
MTDLWRAVLPQFIAGLAVTIAVTAGTATYRTVRARLKRRHSHPAAERVRVR